MRLKAVIYVADRPARVAIDKSSGQNHKAAKCQELNQEMLTDLALFRAVLKRNEWHRSTNIAVEFS